MSLLDDMNSLSTPSKLKGPASPGKFAEIDAKAEQAYGLPPGILAAVGQVESNHNPNAINYNKNGTIDKGRFQINSVNKGLDGNNPYDAAKILRSNLDAAGGDVMKALGMYNVGRNGNLNGKVAQSYMAKYASLMSPEATPGAIPSAQAAALGAPQVPQTPVSNPIQQDGQGVQKLSGMAADMDSLMSGNHANEATTQKTQYSPQVVAQEQQPSTWDNFTAGVKAGVQSPILGVKQALDAGASYLAGSGIGRAVDAAGQVLGMPSAQQAAQETERDIAQNKIDQAAASQTAAGTAGNIAGQIGALVPTAFIPGANTLGGAAAIGGVTSALTTTGDVSDRLKSGALGIAGGAGGYAVGKGLSALANQYAIKKGSDIATNVALTASRKDVLNRAAQQGYKFSPSDINPGGNSTLSSLGTKNSINAYAAHGNQKITNNLARGDLGLSADTPLSVDTLAAIRREAGQAYQAMGNVGTINAGPEYQNALKEIVEQTSGELGSFPGAKLNNVKEVLAPYNQASFSSQDAIRASNQLRSMADTAYAQGDSLTGKAYKQASGALEDAIGAQLKASGDTQTYEQFQNARKLIAKTYSYQNALNPATGDVDAVKLASMLKKGVPLSGGAKDIAETALMFPKAMANLKEAPVGFSPLQTFGSVVLGAIGAAGLGPGGTLLATLPAINAGARGVALSRPYQALQRGLAQSNFIDTLAQSGANLVGSNPGAMATLGSLSGVTAARNAKAKETNR